MVERAVPLVALVALMVLAGCSEPPEAKPVADEEVAEEQAPPPVSLAVHRAGTVLFRAPGDGPLLQYTGDSPCFEFDLPSGSAMLNGTLAWTPEQTPMMLQFGNLNTFDYYQTDDDVPLSGSISSPIALSVEDPGSGPWFAYMGPGAVGGGATFELDFSVNVPADLTVEDLHITDSGC